MEIVIHAMGMPFNGETIERQSLGGSESAAYYQARELARRGHRVSVWSNTEKDGEWDGVRYYNLGNATPQAPLGDRFEYWARQTPHDVLIVQRHPAAFHAPFASKINVWQLHDLALYRQAGVVNHGMWQVNFVTTVSEYHKQQVCEVYGFDPAIVKIVPNGVDDELYGAKLKAFEDDTLGSGLSLLLTKAKGADKFMMLYQSRPERGLEHLLRPGGIMERLATSRPNAHLLYCAYANTVPEMQAYYARLEAYAKRLPNVTNLGALTKVQLAIVQQRCDLLVYPTTFKEVSCISVMEAMHAGLPVLTTPVGALVETLHDAGVRFVPLTDDGQVSEDGFAWNITEWRDRDTDMLRKQQLKAAHRRTWVHVVDTLERELKMAFGVSSPGAIARHAMEYSDVALLDALEDDPLDDRIATHVFGKESRLYDFTKSHQAYQAHYEKHQGVYYDAFEEKVIGEDVTASPRYRGVERVLDMILVGREGLRVLDYGCAHGHYLIPLAKRFPQVRFVGMDVSARAIKAAVAWAQREGLDNVEFIVGSELDVSPAMCPLARPNVLDIEAMERGDRPERKLFDVVLAGEVIEHVIDYSATLARFREVIEEFGFLVATTPVGRWEWTGHEAFKTGREHLAHFERQDIVEICNGNQVEITYAPAPPDETGAPRGSWVWAVQPVRPFGKIDMTRKLRQLVPRQTLSACLIVKDAERTLRRCVESFVEYVDEVVIAIDPTTKDRTREIAEALRKDYGLKPFVIVEGLEALKTGFDAARNYSVSFASGNWVLWIDADEEVQCPWNIWKYLRPSMHPAIGFPQMHYSVDPPGVLTTDFPCRLFRNNRGIKFYGLVHEHPEVEVGKAIPHATIRHDVKFLHCGYVDETVRRQRFHRNLPLVLKDVETYPARRLNNFLLLRDLAQGIVFEQEQVGGTLQEHLVRAQRGIEVFEKILEHEPVRLIVDAMRYYSACVMVLGKGFDAKVGITTIKQEAPDLKVDLSVEGRFYSREHFNRLINRIHQEATKHYESEYL